MPFLSMGDTVSLDNAVTKSEARPHLTKAYKGLESPGINGHVYEIKEDCSCRDGASVGVGVGVGVGCGEGVGIGNGAAMHRGTRRSMAMKSTATI